MSEYVSDPLPENEVVDTEPVEEESASAAAEEPVEEGIKIKVRDLDLNLLTQMTRVQILFLPDTIKMVVNV